jgi:hypothetical protein
MAKKATIAGLKKDFGTIIYLDIYGDNEICGRFGKELWLETSTNLRKPEEGLS